MYTQLVRNRVGAGRGLLVIVLLALIGCSSVTQSSIVNNNQPSNETASTSNNNAAMENEKNIPANEVIDSRLVSANTGFGLKLYAEVAKANAGKNVFISPASVGLALAMTYNGAVGETKQAMERALEIQGMNHLELNRAYAALRQALENPDPKVQLNIANSLWAKQGVTFNPDFIERNKQFYGAEVSTLDFNNPSAPSTINSWVADKTKGKIDKIVDRIDPQSILFLINAIYFKGKWAEEFDKAKTKEEPFTTAPGQQKRHPMMHQSGKYNYYEAKSFQAVSIPYGGDRVSMYIFLPTASTTLIQLQNELTAANWDSWMKQFAKIQGEIAVPRFKVEYEVELSDSLKALGMGIAFDPRRADLTGICKTSENPFISRVKHKTFAEVNEEGTEAAAATSVEVTVTSAMRPQKTFRMVVDHPFFFAIRDNKTGTLLFMGSINDPT
ncbi:MAG TPA: serpin family protein [Blastocatellia bacterium]|nr:serpin family protein [Blastocatellia bacterium]